MNHQDPTPEEQKHEQADEQNAADHQPELPVQEEPVSIERTVSPEVLAVHDRLRGIYAQSSKVLVGQEELLDLMLICLLAEGHVLLEGVPGIAKTLSAKVLSRNIDSEFSRFNLRRI